jgi:hypothetical protein
MSNSAGIGRPHGALNHTTREMKAALHQFLSGPEYRESVTKRILAGSAPTIELYFLQLLYGKPREHIELEVSQSEDLSQVSTEDLAARAEALLLKLKEAQELEAAIPTECVVESLEPVTTTLTPSARDELRDQMILNELRKRNVHHEP